VKCSIENKDLEFHFNPFAGVVHEDITEILVPKFNVPSLLRKIQKDDPRIVELVRRKGRGKTTHLLHLQQHLPQYPIFLLNKGACFEEILHHPSPVVFIDSMHHLNIVQRQRIFRQKRVVVLTTHWTKAWEYALAGKPMHRLRFRGLSVDALGNDSKAPDIGE
jgi:hypothetical protein